MSTADFGGKQPISPSGVQQFTIDGAPFGSPRPMTRSEIYQLIEHFITAAARAKKTGYDMVELHCAHGYLLSAFLSPATNKREDEFGGSTENRARIVVDIIKGIHQEAGDDFPISVRINADDFIPEGLTTAESPTIARILQEAGANIISVSCGMYASHDKMDDTMNLDEGWKLPLWVSIKKAITIPTTAGGGNRTPAFCEKLLIEGHADFVGLGRPLYADPYWPQKVMEGREGDINNCVSCLRCLFALGGGFQDLRHCSVNAMLGREVEYVDRRSPATKKKVMVVGGGVAGMEAARVAALRGHSVTLYEKQHELGGQLLLASVPVSLGKHKLLWFCDYLINQLKGLGVKVELGNEVTVDTVRKMKPDVVIIATGAQPEIPDIPGIENAKVTTAWDVLAGKQKVLNQNVAVLGGNAIGCETTEVLAEQGNRVTVIKRRPTVAEDMEPLNRHVLLTKLEEHQVKILTGQRVVEVTDEGVGVVDTLDGTKQTIKVDKVVLALGARPVLSLTEDLEGEPVDFYVVGDCQEPRTILDAVADGFLIGYKI